MGTKEVPIRFSVWFQDECRFGQQGTLTRVWARTGSRVRAVRQTQYDYLYVVGAVCPKNGESCGLLLPYLDTNMLNLFLVHLSNSVGADEHIILIWDGAGYHTSHSLQVPDNITLLQLPPYSPELNPVENLWHFLKSHYWANRVYKNYQALMEAAQDAWQAVCMVPERIKSICAGSYLDAAINY